MAVKRILRNGLILLLVAVALLAMPYHSAVQTNAVDLNVTLPINCDSPSVELELKQTAAVQPESRYIEMDNIQQLPELPAGCEVTSLAIVLNYLDYSVSKTRLADNYLPCSDDFYMGSDGELYGPNQNDVFVGDPHSNQYGCYAPVIVRTANSYLEECGSEYTASDISGENPEELYRYVLDGIPVIVWATIRMQEIPSYIEWFDFKTGEKLRVPNRQHCLVLVGVDGEMLTFNDPYDPRGIVQYPKSLFEKRYNAVGKQAVVLTAS